MGTAAQETGVDEVKVTHQAMRELLASVGPLTSREAAEFFEDSSHMNVSAVLSTMRTAARKQVYIIEWARDIVQEREYLRAVYALGDKPDARKPQPLTNAQKLARSRAKYRIPKVNSVWTWGQA
jgi:hypothetical protein